MTTNPEGGRMLRADAVRNRERILVAAAEVFADRGLEATLHDVAAHAGVGIGTVYRRFADKSVLVEALFDRKVQQMVDLTEAAGARPEAGEALLHLLDTLAGMLAADSGLLEVIASSGYGSDRVASTCEQLFTVVTSLLERAQAEGTVRADLELADLSVVLFMLSDVAQRTRTARPDVWRRYLELVLDSLRAQPRREALSVPALSPTELLSMRAQRDTRRRGRLGG